MEAQSAILVVEDDELVQAFLLRALAGMAERVDACADAASAYKAVELRSYGLILLDGLLPDLHGVELGRRLIAAPSARHSALCLVSGSLRHPHPATNGIAALPKPLRVRDLLATAAELLDWSRSATVDEAARQRTLEALAADLLVW